MSPTDADPARPDGTLESDLESAAVTTPDSLAQTKGRGVRWPGSVLAVPPLRPRAALTRRQVLTETWLVLLVSLGLVAQAEGADRAILLRPGQVGQPQPVQHLDEMAHQRAFHLVPMGKTAQVEPIRVAFDEPGIILTALTLEIGLGGLQITDESGQAPPLPMRHKRAS